MYEEILAKINQLKRNGGVGYTEGGRKTITRKSDDLVTILGDIQAEKVSNVPIDLNTVESMHIQTGKSFLDVQKSGFFMTADAGIQGISLADAEMPYIISIFEDMPDVANKGTYIPVYKAEDGATNCCMFFAYNEETIHTIDPKYLPAGSGGGGLPVVELSLSVEEGSSDLNEGDSAKIEELNGQPFILRAFMGSDGFTECGIVSVVSLGNIKVCSLETPMSTIAVQNTSGKWEAVRLPKESPSQTMEESE